MGEWIVVVDDETLSLTNARSMLVTEGMKVSCLRSGSDLLRFMEKNQPDLVLLDIMMPEMDGFSAFQALRKLEEDMGRLPTPVIFLTGDGDVESERRGLADGASDFVRKPFNRDILLSRIQKALRNRKMLETLLERASMDKLTGFLNKSSGTEEISRICETESGSLIIIDLDNFKLVNDIYGHDMGDKVLQGFAQILKNNLRPKDTISRIGGDEFLLFLKDLCDKDDLEAIFARINQLLEKELVQILGEEHGIPLGVSAGVVFVPEHGRDYNELFQYADGSLYRVKQNGKHNFEIYSVPEDAEYSDSDQEREFLRVTQLMEERGIGRGALLLGQDAFTNNYHLIMRFIRRNRMMACRMMFSLDIKENVNNEDIDMVDAVELFGTLLQNSLRKYDIIFQNRPNCYYLLLPGLTEKNVPVVKNRIINCWKDTKYYDGIRISSIENTVSYTEM